MKAFSRRIENFTCENCGTYVMGNGYTNHCPDCLWSKHVDTSPGNRLSDCGGLMQPIGVRQSGNKYVLKHKCVKCGHIKENKVSEDDNFNEIIRISGGGI